MLEFVTRLFVGSSIAAISFEVTELSFASFGLEKYSFSLSFLQKLSISALSALSFQLVVCFSLACQSLVPVPVLI